MSSSGTNSGAETLRMQKFVSASPARVFSAWTEPEEMKKWWGPKGVNCQSADIDLRVGGNYRIANGMPDGSVLWISGRFEVIEAPHLLVYTWVVENENPATERVKVQFEQRDSGTDVIITHERIADKILSARHQQGWEGCLEGLIELLA